MISRHGIVRTIVASALALAGMIAAPAGAADVDQRSVARGGRLYDKWYKEIKVDAPTVSHPLYPAANEKYAKDPASNWRCKECHGWDRQGAAGGYAKGSHATGIIGIDGMSGGDPAAVIAILTSEGHGYGDKLSQQDLADLANFVVYGKVEWPAYIDPETKEPKGDAEAGKQVFNTICANCHGLEGKLPKEMPPLASLMSNPWEVMHKILNGQPNEAMPALRAIDNQVAADILAHLKTLPEQ